MRWRAGLVAGTFAISVLSGVAGAPVASACSCVLQESVDGAVDRLRSVPGAFIGTPVRRLSLGGTTTYEFEVREVFTGQIGSRLLVSTPTSGAACGAGYAMDREQLVLVSDRGDVEVPGGLGPWYGDSCLSAQSSVHSDEPGTVPGKRELAESALGPAGPPGGPLVTALALGPAALSRPFLSAAVLAIAVTAVVAVGRVWKSRR